MGRRALGNVCEWRFLPTKNRCRAGTQRCSPVRNSVTAARYTPLIRTAKITGVSGEFLCVVSDISATGVSVRLFHPLPRDLSLNLEMPNGDILPLERVWEKDGRAGFRFAADIDLSQVLDGHGRWPKRPIRLNLDMPAKLAGLTGRFDATIKNISMQGAQIECAVAAGDRPAAAPVERSPA